MEYLYGIVAAIGVSVILTLISKRQRESSWQGTVTAVQPYSVETDDGCRREGVRIHYRRDDGRKGKLDMRPDVFRRQYPDIQKGDRLMKEAGEYMPHASRPT